MLSLVLEASCPNYKDWNYQGNHAFSLSKFLECYEVLLVKSIFSYAKFMRQEQRRMSTFYHRLVALTSRQEMKRRKQLSVYAERMKQMEAFVTPHVDTVGNNTNGGGHNW